MEIHANELYLSHAKITLATMRLAVVFGMKV